MNKRNSKLELNIQYLVLVPAVATGLSMKKMLSSFDFNSKNPVSRKSRLNVQVYLLYAQDYWHLHPNVKKSLYTRIVDMFHKRFMQKMCLIFLTHHIGGPPQISEGHTAILWQLL